MTGTRICSACSKEFRPSSGHKMCPPCRRKALPRSSCLSCGVPTWPGNSSCPSCSTKGPLNHAWRGGSVRHKAGYVMIRVPEHPRAPGNSGYVFEHILVMESILGRQLLPGENVHHLNGVKDDNSPSNLELWAKPQPSGARVSDLVDWAVRLLQVYAPEKLSNS